MHLGLYEGHWKMFPPIAVIYSYINYLEVQRRGRPLYWFLTWEDYTTVVICAFMTLCLCFIWVAAAKLTSVQVESKTIDPQKQK